MIGQNFQWRAESNVQPKVAEDPDQNFYANNAVVAAFREEKHLLEIEMHKAERLKVFREQLHQRSASTSLSFAYRFKVYFDL